MMAKCIKVLLIRGFAGLVAWVALVAWAEPVDAPDYSEWSSQIPEDRRAFWLDADQDGLPNGLEYARGTDPLRAEEDLAGAVAFRMVEEAGEREGSVDVRLPDQPRADVILSLEMSRDLQVWETVACRFGEGNWMIHRGNLSPVQGDGGGTCVRWTGTGQWALGERVFHRLSMELLQATDGDGDGLLDQWERQFGLDPAVADGEQDADGDGLGNWEEYQAGTNPVQADTDGDGTYDGCQVAWGGTLGPPVPALATGLLVLTPSG